MYEITLIALKSANNERLWFNTNLKLARVYLESRKLQEVERLIAILKQSCQLQDGTDDPTKGTNLLEIYCLEIQYCSVTHNVSRMRTIYPRTLHLNAAVADPRIMGIIREEGGKIHMMEGNWEDAFHELNEAFRMYQEAGNARARDCLKYVVLASMLALSDINPFAAREAKVFADDKEILAMSELRQSLEANDLPRFEKILRNKQNHIIDEPFLMTYIEQLRRRMREQVLLNLVKPFKKVKMDYLAKELSLNTDEVEILLVDMILDERLQAEIDQIKGHVILSDDVDPVEKKKFSAIRHWAESLSKINDSFESRYV
jgi:COP9 signalosome complex subunit 2